jgi:peptidyl-prolyl cis-trans isomerase C
MAERVSASHILISHAESPGAEATRSREDALEEIEGIRKELEDGADFAELASSRSDCPSKSRGGNLGEFGRGQMVPSFEAAAFDLDVGNTSEVIETDFGYHLIYRDE